MLLYFLTIVTTCLAQHNIESFGAIADTKTFTAAQANANALVAALRAANASTVHANRTVVVPQYKRFYTFHVWLDALHDVQLSVQGQLLASDLIDNWPWPISTKKGGDFDYGVLQFHNARNFNLTGGGVIDGQGYPWWVKVLEGGGDERPHMVYMQRGTNILISNLWLRNSPMFHLKIHEVDNLIVRDVNIFVEVFKQKTLLHKHGRMQLTAKGSWVPTFPLNTDGIDPSGRNVLIERVNIENFDDAVAVKPLSGKDRFPCSQNMLIRDSKVTFSVGLSIGSVPPNSNTNCIKNITFENIQMTSPIKAIYVKSNPGTHGSAIVSDLTYRNIEAQGTLWMPIWIGPQQQRQPGTKGTGCSFFYPIDNACPTNPLVHFQNFHFENIVLTDGVLMPGVFLCDKTTPCVNFTFRNVTSSGLFEISHQFVCKNMKNSTITDMHPMPKCV